MTRKKTTRKKGIKGNPERALRNKRIAIAGAMFLGAGAVFAGAAMGVGELDRRAAAAIVPGSPAVEIDWPSDARGAIWLPIAERDRLTESVRRAVSGGHALSGQPLREAALALAGSGWVVGTPRASWTGDGRIVLDAQWRVPAAAVRVGKREIIIDWDRTVLPVDYALGQSNQYYFTNTDAPLPDIGQPWPGTDLEDGLRLLQLLQHEGLLEQIAGFDLGNGPESGTIRIITKRDTTIIWGAGPGRERPGEQPSSVKVERLKALYNRAGLIDGGVPLIDIRGADIMVNAKDG